MATLEVELDGATLTRDYSTSGGLARQIKRAIHAGATRVTVIRKTTSGAVCETDTLDLRTGQRTRVVSDTHANARSSLSNSTVVTAIQCRELTTSGIRSHHAKTKTGE